MEELQCIKLTKEFKSLPIDTKGTIVLKYGENDFLMSIYIIDNNKESLN